MTESEYIISSLDRHEAHLLRLEEKVDGMRADIATLQVKVGRQAGFYGAIGGAFAVLLPLAIAVFVVWVKLQ